MAQIDGNILFQTIPESLVTITVLVVKKTQISLGWNFKNTLLWE